MIDLFIQIPGPTFLLYFTGLTLICIVIGWLWANADSLTVYPLPTLTRFDSVVIALLRGGIQSAILTAFFRLWSRNLVKFEDIEKDIVSKSEKSPLKISGVFEQEILHFLQTPRSIDDLLLDTSLSQRFEMHHMNIRKELEQMHLVQTETDRKRARKASLIMGLVIGIIGGSKLVFGLIYGRPFYTLAYLLVVFLVIHFFYVKPKPAGSLTRLGRRYVKSLKEHFFWLKESIQDKKTLPEGIDPSLPIAIFGIGIMAGTSFWNAIPSDVINQPSVFFSGFFYGGCGGGCGGCGGGCGGCGGGCGG